MSLSNNGEKPKDPTNIGDAQKAPPPQPVIIPPELNRVLRSAGIDPQDPNVTRTAAISLNLMMASGSLPLPPPSVLSEYNQVFPGLVDKIISWTDAQREHRQTLEKQRAEGIERRQDRGQLIAATVGLWGLTLAAGVGIFGSTTAAAIIAIVCIGGPTAAVWFARNTNVQKPPTPATPAPVPVPASPGPHRGAGDSTG